MEIIKSNILIKRLDAFIKKFYLNRIIKGSIISLSILGLIYLALISLEYFGHFPVAARTFLFYIGLAGFIAVFVIMIVIPLLKLFKIGKCINYKQASHILGEHFAEVGDKLQNTIELSEIIEENPESRDLIIASINQRTEQLSPVPFLSAVKLNQNLKYFKFFAPVLILFLSVLTFWPFIITEGTERIVKHRTFFERPAPFTFELLNDTLTARRGADFKVKVKTSGRLIPDRVMLNYRGTGFYMQQESPGIFVYDLKNLNNDLNFYFSALDIRSKDFNLNVLPAPIIIDFLVKITPPAYTGIENSVVENSGDISVPLGSKAEWNFNTSNIDKLAMIFDTIEVFADKKDAHFSFNKQILNPGVYSIYNENEHFKEQTGIKYQINVIPDLYPSISVNEIRDSADATIYYFNGLIDDDYGFKSLTFNYIPGENSDTTISINIPFSPNMRAQSFFYAFDFSSVEVDGRTIRYYFEVGDNDGIHGSKKTRTETREFVIPSMRDIEAESERILESIDSNISEAKRISDQIRRDIDRLQRDLIDDQLSEWERSQTLKDIFDKQMQLEDLVKNISHEQQSLKQQNEQWTKNEEMVKKHEQIQELLESLFDDEMKELLEKLQELSQNFDMSEFMDLMKDMQHTADDMEKQMERALELLKRMEVEQRLQNTADKLQELAEEHKNLSEQTKDADEITEDILQQQQEHQDEFEKIREEFEKALEKNQELKSPYKLDDFKQDYQNISDGFDGTMDQLNMQDSDGASGSQMQNAEQMQELSDKLQQMMSSQMQAQRVENMQNLRQILDNLLTFSFDQEDIMVNQRNINSRDPRYRDYMVRQRRTQDNFSIIRDSLNALGMRVPELGPTIQREQASIYRNLELVINEMGETRPQNVPASQQLIMTSANNLALLLSELMEQMQQELAMQMGGSGGDCNSGMGLGEGEMGEMRNIQEGLKQQLQDLIDQLKEGGMQQPGPGHSEELAKMLKQQEIMQKMLNDMMMGGQLSPETSKILNEINQMIEQNISDLINRNIRPETLLRHEEILTRLLEAENSEREREIDDQRQSEEARDYKLSSPDKAFKEKEEELRFNELLQISNIKLNKYYQNKYKEYLKKLGE